MLPLSEDIYTVMYETGVVVLFPNIVELRFLTFSCPENAGVWPGESLVSELLKSTKRRISRL